MNTKAVVISVALLSLTIIIGIFLYTNSVNKAVKGVSTNFPQEVRREIVQYPINPKVSPDVSANRLPTFTYDISSRKFQSILSSTGSKLKDFISATVVRKVDASSNIISHIEVDSKNKKLLVRPEEVANFKPGLYKMSLSMRTLEGEVNIEQDFSWGVIAVNTNKSIYKPYEDTKIGIGVLDEAGYTQCMSGFNHITDLKMTVTDPSGNKQFFSIKDKTILTSDECGPTSVTYKPDFSALYKTSIPGIYQMEVEANVRGVTRKITDYFKVDNDIQFDIERLSYPMRIYPQSVYPATFTITARNDYSGEVSNIIPGSFHVEHISDGGKIVEEGDFKRVIWNVNFKAGERHDFTYFMHFPKVSPEFYLDGPIKIGNFAEARQWQIASDAVNSTSGLVSYEDNGGSNTWSRVWTGTTWNPALGSPATSMSTAPTDSRWFREVSSPKTGEKIVALIDNVGANDRLFLFTWNGSAWTQDKNFAINSTAADVTRPFDIAYEELSGDALFVYSDYSNAQLKYYKRVNGVWDAGTTAAEGGNAGVAYDVYKRWIIMKSQFESDSILVGYVNNNSRIGAMIWDGSTNTFGNQFSDASGTAAATSADQSFDIAWETQSGTPMIFWGTTGNDIIYREFTSGTWQAETTAISGFTNDIDWLLASSDPLSTSDNIAIATQELVTPACRALVWTGSTMVRDNNSVPCASATTNNLTATAFENNSGKAMWILISTGSATMSWKTWTASSGFSSLTTEAGSTTNIEGVQLYSDLNTKSMIALYHDNSNGSFSNDCQLWDREWDGTSWSALNASPIHARICSSGDNDTEPYGFGFDRNLETLVAYRWFANSVDLGAGLTTLTSQDTPYTLTTANQAFRLRMLLYYPDSLLTSTNRQYKLQYVDPGTGTCSSPTGGTPSTWTDVPTSGGSTISFYNNLTIGSGDNISTNSADPSYQGKVVDYQDYQESNNFTNSRTNMQADHTAIWDFSLVDNTTYDRVAQNYCFRVARSNDLVLRINLYPQISTASVDDVLIQGGTQIDGGVTTNN